MLGGYLSYLFDLSTLEGGRGGSFEKLQKFSGHRVDQNTVTVTKPTVTSQTHGDARLELHNPLAQTGSNS